jgi:hypothetical protein
MSFARPALNRLASVLGGVAVGIVAGLSPAIADDIIVLEGITTSKETSTGQIALSQTLTEEGRSSFCRDFDVDEGDDYASRGEQIVYEGVPAPIVDMHFDIADQLGNVDPDLERDYNDMLGNDNLDAVGKFLQDEWIDDACESPETEVFAVTLIYSSCRMTMRDGTNMIDVRFPPGTGQGWLTFMDPATLQAIEQSIEFAQLLNRESGALQGEDTDTITGPGEGRDQEIAFNFGQSLNLPASRYTFTFDFELNLARSLMGLAGISGDLPEGGEASAEELAELEQFMAFAPTPKFHSTGFAWITPDAPGLDIIRTFYRTFAEALDADQASMLGGLLNHRLLESGLPLELEQTTEVQMPGLGAFMGGAGSTQRSESTMKIGRIIGPLSTDYAYCNDSIVPPEYTVTNPASAVTSAQPSTGSGQGANANAGAAANAGAEGMPDLTETMDAVNQALASMTPEQQAAMQQAGAGLGGLLSGLGGAMPGATPPASATPAPAPTRSSGLSSALMTDDLAQSAQNLLQALGYDTGDSEVERAIAISQFQAEQGLEVTGEVTPQLVGGLAAAVDSL